MMSALAYVVVTAAWIAEAAYMLPALYSIYIHQTRRGDPARLVCFGYGILMIGFLVRRFAEGEPIDESLSALLTLSFVMALVTLLTARSYGRGPIIETSND